MHLVDRRTIVSFEVFLIHPHPRQFIETSKHVDHKSLNVDGRVLNSPLAEECHYSLAVRHQKHCLCNVKGPTNGGSKKPRPRTCAPRGQVVRQSQPCSKGQPARAAAIAAYMPAPPASVTVINKTAQIVIMINIG